MEKIEKCGRITQRIYNVIEPFMDTRTLEWFLDNSHLNSSIVSNNTNIFYVIIISKNNFTSGSR